MGFRKRIDIYKDGSAESESVEQAVRKAACPLCIVTVHEVDQMSPEEASSLGVASLPAVKIDGKEVDWRKVKR